MNIYPTSRLTKLCFVGYCSKNRKDVYSINCENFITQLIYTTVRYHGWDDVIKQQILSFWTTLCCLNDLNPDTYGYDTLLNEIYQMILKLIPNDADASELKDFEDFDKFMCQYLV